MHRAAHIALLLALAGAPLLAQETPPAAPEQPEPPPAPRQISPDAVAVLQSAAEAVKDGFAATARSYCEGASAIAGFFPKIEGRWSQRALGDGTQWGVRYTGIATVINQNDPVNFDVLWLPERITWLDHDAKTFNVQLPPPRGRPSGQAYQLASSAWGQAEPLTRGFAETLDTAAALELRDPVEVDGVMCTVVAITQKAGSDATLWYFGLEDHLPRRCELVLPETPEVSGALRLDFEEGVAGSEAVSEADWTMLPPDGYTQQIARQLQEKPEQPAPAAPAATAPGAAGPDWEVPDSTGALVSPGALRGKVSVLYFWGTWSPACKKATPVLKAYADDYKDKPVEVVSMAFREGAPEAVVKAAAEEGQTWRQVTAADDVVQMLGIRVAPSFVVLGPQGELLLRTGRPKGDDYEALFAEIRQITDRALAEPPPAGKEASDSPAPKGPADHVAPTGVTPAKPGGLPTRRKGG